jgi:uncharacterized SAM-dependent methyltransferase
VQAARAADHQRRSAVDERQDDPILASASSTRRARAKHTLACQFRAALSIEIENSCKFATEALQKVIF